MTQRRTEPTPNTPQAPIKGEIHQWREPNWAPLLALVGKELTGWFMWMGEIRLVDGTAVHAYKHRDTRRYCHLGEDGRAFEFIDTGAEGAEDRGLYRPITRLESIDEPLGPWRMSYLEIADIADYTRRINEAREVARGGEQFPVDPEELELQRAFEARQRAELREDDREERAA